MMKKHMVPLSKGGSRTVHKGKGSQMAGMPDRSQIKGLSAPGANMNNYAKASPMPQGVDNDEATPMPPGMPGGF